jgi:hypothetical protein
MHIAFQDVNYLAQQLTNARNHELTMNIKDSGIDVFCDRETNVAFNLLPETYLP